MGRFHQEEWPAVFSFSQHSQLTLSYQESWTDLLLCPVFCTKSILSVDLTLLFNSKFLLVRKTFKWLRQNQVDNISSVCHRVQFASWLVHPYNTSLAYCMNEQTSNKTILNSKEEM